MGKNSIDKKYYERIVYFLPKLIRGQYRLAIATAQDKEAYKKRNAI